MVESAAETGTEAGADTDGVSSVESSVGAGGSRRDELAERLEAVRTRVAHACEAAGRPAHEVHLVVVTKFFPASDVAALAGLGVGDVGESRDQEAGPKLADLEAAVRQQLRVHFIGQLQSNKAASVARYADEVHSVDRAKIVRVLERAAGEAGRRLGVYVQVDLEEPVRSPSQPSARNRRSDRGGVSPQDAPALADLVAGSQHLELRGVMTVAPGDGDPDAAFARLQEVAAVIRAVHPEALSISAGMSADLEQAVAHGATHLRVGSAILGSRPALG